MAGSAAGFLLATRAADPSGFADRVFLLTLIAIAIALPAAAWAWKASRENVLLVAVVVAFFAGGASLASDAWRRAWRPTLKVVFEEFVAMAREEAAAGLRVLPEDPSVPATLTGVLRADAAPRDDTVSLSLDVLTIDGPSRPPTPWLQDVRPPLCIRQVRGGVLLSVAGQLTADRIGDWTSGRTIRAPVVLQRPSRYMNPGGQDAERALARRGSVLVGTVKSGALVEVVARGSVWAETMARGRAGVRRAVNSAVGRWSPRAAGIVNAIVIGDRAGLAPETQRTLQEAGTYHVVAISGGNIAILAGLALAGFRLAGVLGPGAMIAAIGVLAAYASLVGGGASVNRATLMAIVYFAARAIDLRSPPFNALSLVVMLLVASDPLCIVDPAFLLTCGATAAILAAGALTRPSGRHRVLAPVSLLLTASVAAELVLLPVGAVVFSRITFAGLLLNFAAIPLMAVVQLAGMLVVPLSWMSWMSDILAACVGWIAYAAAEGLVLSSGLVRFMPVLIWRVAPPHWLAIAVYYLTLLCVVYGIRLPWPARSRRQPDFGRLQVCGIRRQLSVCGIRLPWPERSRRQPDFGGLLVGGIRRRGPMALAFIAAAAWILLEPWTFLTSRGDGRLHITFIDVGQGDAALVTFPRGRSLLVDAGGSVRGTYDVGDRVVAPLLRRAGMKRIDVVALTHGDADHIGGLPAIVDEFAPSEIWEGVPVPRFAPLGKLRQAALGAGARWTNVLAGHVTAIDGVEIAVRHPALPDWERQDVRNDDSIVLEVRWKNASIVLTGDIGTDVERSIASSFAPSTMRVVKVPHHGSLSSSSVEFLEALAPRVAVVSAGRSNTFGHPAPAVLARYADIGAEVFRTDRDGAVQVVTDGYSLQVTTFSGKSESFHEGAKDTKETKDTKKARTTRIMR